jgi:hypothetical protein
MEKPMKGSRRVLAKYASCVSESGPDSLEAKLIIANHYDDKDFVPLARLTDFLHELLASADRQPDQTPETLSGR